MADLTPQSVLIANDFPPIVSGIATFFYEMCRHLPPHQLTICAPRIRDSGLIDRGYPLPIVRLPIPFGEHLTAKLVKSLVPSIWLLKRCLDNPPKKLHCGQVFSSGTLGLFCKRTFGIPYIVYVYGSETVRLGSTPAAATLMRLILDESQAVVTVSEATSDEFRAFGVSDHKLKRIYPGVDPNRFKPTPRDETWVERLALEGRRTLLTVARLDQRKGHDTVIRALPHLPDDVVYLVAGKGREEHKLRALADQLGVTSRVRFLGFVSDEDLPAVYNLADLFVMPNRVTEGTHLGGDIEGFGISFVEAGACGKAAIGCRSGGAVEAIIEGETGRLISPGSEEELVETICDLLDHPKKRAELGANGRRRAEEELDWRVLSNQLANIL